MSTLETPPPDTTTLAVAPFHVPDAEPLNSLTFWNVPFVYVAPPVIVPVLIPLNPCSRLNPIVAIPADESTVEIDRPTPKTLRILSTDSLVILFLRSLVTTSPRGALFANETAAGGLSLKLSLSNCGYKSTTF